MNITNIVQTGISARLFAGITIVSLLLSALPVAFFVANAAGLYSNSNQMVDSTAEFASGTIDASTYENLVFSFDFDATQLDATPSVDSFVYGWRDAGGDNDISNFNGLVGSDPSETSSISVPLPVVAQVSDLEVYVRVVADNTSPNDEVLLTNISVTGDVAAVACTSQVEDGLAVGPVENTDTNQFFTTIQNAIDDCDTVGGHTIEVASGTYNEALMVDKSVALQGPNHAISAVTGTRVAEAVITEHLRTNVATDVEVSGFEFTGVQTTSFTIYVIGNSEGFTFNNNRFINNDKVAIKTPETGVAKDLTIKGNLISGVTGTNQSGLFLGGVSGDSVVTGNKIVDTAYGGIVVSTADGLLIADNEIVNVPQQGIQLAIDIGDVTIQNNIITDANTDAVADKGAIRLYASDVTGAVLITNNTISGGHNGIAIKDGQDLAGKDIIIVDNDVLAPNTGVQIYNGGTGELDVEENWWGVDTGIQSSGGAGTLDADPFLCGSFGSSPAVSVNGSCLPAETATVSATKIVCDYESELPNMSGGADITATTASDWLAANLIANPDTTCREVTDWEFQWAPNGTAIPGNWNTVLGSVVGWNTFTGTVDVPLVKNTNNNNNQPINIREILQPGYITFGNKNPISAELYCASDVLGYDNKENIMNPVAGETYHCVAWNATPSPDPENQNQFTFSGNKFNNANENRGRETGEETLYDWDFNMYKEVAGVWTYIVTASVNPADAAKNAGKFVFPQQTKAGTYHVCEVAQPGWTQVRQDWSGTPYHIITDNMSPNKVNEGEYCATAVYTDEADRSKSAAFGNFLKEIPTKYADVTMCKEDEQGNKLAGWQLALLGDSVTSLAFAPTAATQSMTAIPDGDYVLKAAGTYGYGNGGRSADARFSERKPGEANYVGPYVPWAVASVSSQGLAVQVEGNSTLWGNVYSPAHVYYGAFNQANTGDIDFTMYDNQYADNSGTIDLTLHQGFTGITGENGCVVFEDVPYGEYEVEELVQSGFENTSGLGSVVVDEDQETFTVVNNDLSYVAPCELDIYSDEMTLVKETNQTAKATYDGNNNWTANIANAIWVWATGEVADPENDETYTFVETFTVVNPTMGNITIAHDNWLKLTINDTVIERNYNGYRDTQTYNDDILAALVSGENRIEMEVKNIGVAGSNYLRNPAGALFHIELTGGGESCARTTEPAFSSLTIDSPATNGEVLSGTSTFAATYKDFDNDEDEVFWAIRAGSCNGADMAGNAPVSPFHPSTFDPVTGAFETTVDMSTWTNGDYCLVVNPREDAGAPNERETRTFTLNNQTITDPQPTLVTISGTKSTITDGEPAVLASGWEMELQDGQGTVVATTTTDIDGAYSFTEAAGVYEVHEVMQSPFTQFSVTAVGGTTNTGEVAEYCVFDTTPLLAINPQSTDDNLGDSVVSVNDRVFNCDFVNQTTTTGGEVDNGPGEVDLTPQRTSRTTSGGTRVDGRSALTTAAPAPLVLGAATSQCPFLVDYMQMGVDNDMLEVMKLQAFLNIFRSMYGGTENPITGTFGAVTDANVKAFQEHYKTEILDPWYNLGIVPHDRPTGFVYKTTLWKINSLVCPDSATLPELAGETLQSNTDIDVTPVKD